HAVSLRAPDARAGTHRGDARASGAGTGRRAPPLLSHHSVRHRRRARGSAAAERPRAPGASERLGAGEGLMRLYRALLRLYPSSFRAEYGAEMASIHAQRRQEATGALATLVLWAE